MTTGSKSSHKEVNNQTDLQNNVQCHPKVPLYRFLALDEVKCKTHTQQQISVEKSPKIVNLTENYPKHTFQAPCCCFENGLAIDLLLVKTINVSID